jgi:tRNA (cmo5U34)-methyltransferase
VVPGYREMLDLVAEACGRYLPQEARLIDLGCGTGNASLAVLQKIPSSKIFLVDGSESMVKEAAEKDY